MVTVEEIQHKIDTRSKIIGSLGQLETIARQVCLIQDTLAPELRRPALLLFCGDHGIVDERVSLSPKDFTYKCGCTFQRGNAAITVFCRQYHFHLRVIDAGVDRDFPEEYGVEPRKVGYGTRNFLYEPAMTIEECRRALETGATCVREEYYKDCNVIGFGEMGIGNTSSSAVLAHLYSGIPLDRLVGRGTGLDDAHLEHKYQTLKRAVEAHHPETPLEILATYGGYEIAMMVGGMIEAARLRMVILCDGFIATAAVIAAEALAPGTKECVLYGHVSDEGGHRLLLDYLGGEPILRLGMRLGEGTGAVVAYPIVQSAVAFLNEMASFDERQLENCYEDNPDSIYRHGSEE